MKEKVEIEKVYTRTSDSIVPTLINFQNGELTNFEDNIEYSRFKYKKDGKDGEAVAVNGNIYHGPVTEEKHTKTYLCIRNKITNKMRIVPINQVTVNNNIYNELEKERIAPLPVELSKKIMLKEFGGRKATRYLENQSANLSIDVVKKDLDKTIEESTVDLEDTQSNDQESIYQYLHPKFNVNASKLSEVYDIYDVVPRQLIDRLDEEANAVYETKLENLPIKSALILDGIKKIQNMSISTDGYLKLKLFIYMDGLLNFIKSRARNMKNVNISGISEKVENQIRQNFSNPTNNSFLRTAMGTEKCICYFIVLSLLTSDEYEVDLKMLQQDLCVPKAKFVKLAHIVNARTKSNSDILHLKLPSSMPVLSFRKRKSL